MESFLTGLMGSGVAVAIVGAAVTYVARSMLLRQQHKNIATMEALRQHNAKELETFRQDEEDRRRAIDAANLLAKHIATANPERCGSKFEDMNRIAFELAMRLPADDYRAFTQALHDPSRGALEAVIVARQHLMGDKAGDLVSDEVLFTGQDVGRKES